MYPISTTVKTQIDNFVKPEIYINVAGLKGNTTISDSDIVENSFSIDRKSVNGDKIEIGSAIMSQLKMTLYNVDGKFNSFIFEGAELTVSAKYGVNSVPLGKFTVDSQPRKRDMIELTALDRMARFAKLYDSTLGYPANLWVILDDICTKCNVPNGVVRSELTNSYYSVDSRPNKDDLTYWTVLQWVAALTGTCAYIDWDGKLKMTWYKSTTTVIAPSDRYSSDMHEQDIKITGVEIKANDENGTIYRSGTTGYVVQITGNLLAQSSLQSITNALGTRLNGFTYRPYQCEAKGMPHVYPLDMISFKDKDDVAHTAIITNHTWKVGRSSIAGKGKTAVRDGFATAGAFTARQNEILEKTKSELNGNISDLEGSVNNKITESEQSILSLNEVMYNATGLWPTVITNPDGSETMYLHDKPNIAESSYICTRNAGGYAWTNDGWNNGKPIWQYGTDKDGNAIYRAITAHKLWADLIVAGRLQSKDGSSFWDLDNGLMQLVGTFTAKAKSPDGSFSTSAVLSGDVTGQSSGNTIAGLSFFDKNGGFLGNVAYFDSPMDQYIPDALQLYNKETADYPGSSMALDKAGKVDIDCQMHTVRDRNGAGEVYNSGNFFIACGVEGITPTYNASKKRWVGTANIYINNSFSAESIPVVTVNTSNAYGCIASCTRITKTDDLGNKKFTIYLERSDGPYSGNEPVFEGWETSVTWIVVNTKI